MPSKSFPFLLLAASLPLAVSAANLPEPSAYDKL